MDTDWFFSIQTVIPSSLRFSNMFGMIWSISNIITILHTQFFNRSLWFLLMHGLRICDPELVTWWSSSSLAMASKMCLGVTRPFLLSLAALPASSRISAESTTHEELHEDRKASDAVHGYRWSQMHRTCQVLQYCSHVHRSSDTNPVFGKPSFNIAQHPSHREDHASPSRPGRLGDLLLPTSTGHDAWGTNMMKFPVLSMHFFILHYNKACWQRISNIFI